MTYSTATPKDSTPVSLLSSYLTFRGKDDKLWWDNTAPVIGGFLAAAHYKVASQFEFLLFYHKYILPSLGHYPSPANEGDRWKSFLYRRGEPLELSFNYQKDSNCTVRLALEPVGPNAGTKDDPLNEFEAKILVEKIAQLDSNIDLQWVDFLDKEILLHNDELSQIKNTELEGSAHMSQRLVGVDFMSGGMKIKPYFVPWLKSLVTGVPTLQLMFQAIRKLDSVGSFSNGLSEVEAYLASTDQLLWSEENYLSFDCVDPGKSRIKLYVAEKVTCFNRIQSHWTLGGQLRSQANQEGLLLLKKLWDLLGYPGDPAQQTDRYLPFNFNWELRPSNPIPVPKVYFALGNEPDSLVSKALIGLFTELGWSDQIHAHKRSVEFAFPDCNLEATTHVLTWITVTYEEEKGAYITTYCNAIGGGHKLQFR
ncbi:aromatic prenyltransferase [Penicillium sp. CMV-2018d]|nr:aromatic prenyltransferase [Penicillium sp. CMV-2018d]